MNIQLDQLYAPLTVPHPRRLVNWHRAVDYNHAPVEKGREIDLVHYRFPAPHPGAAGKKLVFISDFHYRGTAPEQRRVDEILAELARIQPDYLLLGGDLCADAASLPALNNLLAALKNTAPVMLAIPGNWERGKSWLSLQYWRNLYAKAGIRFLCNESCEDDAFFIYGCDELGNGYPVLPEHWGGARTNLLLVHRPDTVIALDFEDNLKEVSLALCGHTHGGQVRLPLIGALYASSYYGCRLDYGLFARQNTGMRMLVSSGVGTLSFPWRFRCRREIVLIEFR